MEDGFTILNAIKSTDVANLSLDDNDASSKKRVAEPSVVQEGPRKRAPRFCIGKPPRVVERPSAQRQTLESMVCAPDETSCTAPCDIPFKFPSFDEAAGPSPFAKTGDPISNPILSSSDMELFQMRYLSMTDGEPIAANPNEQANPMQIPEAGSGGGVFDLGPQRKSEEACAMCSHWGCRGLCVADSPTAWAARATSPMSVSSAGSCGYFTGADSGMDYYSCDSDGDS